MSRRRKQRMMRIGSGLVPLGSAAYSADYSAHDYITGLPVVGVVGVRGEL